MNTRNVLGELRQLRRGCDKLIEQIESDPQNDTEDWIDQTQTKLGPRRHCKIVQRRVAAGLLDARILGRKHLLTPAAHAEEGASIGKARLARCRAKRPSPCGTEIGSAYDRAMARATKAGKPR